MGSQGVGQDLVTEQQQVVQQFWWVVLPVFNMGIWEVSKTLGRKMKIVIKRPIRFLRPEGEPSFCE